MERVSLPWIIQDIKVNQCTASPYNGAWQTVRFFHTYQSNTFPVFRFFTQKTLSIRVMFRCKNQSQSRCRCSFQKSFSCMKIFPFHKTSLRAWMSECHNFLTPQSVYLFLQQTAVYQKEVASCISSPWREILAHLQWIGAVEGHWKKTVCSCPYPNT